MGQSEVLLENVGKSIENFGEHVENPFGTGREHIENKKI
jgi:hypothetical protein